MRTTVTEACVLAPRAVAYAALAMATKLFEMAAQ
jgi:hypothetical protein